jgi:hypothetical protein
MNVVRSLLMSISSVFAGVFASSGQRQHREACALVDGGGLGLRDLGSQSDYLFMCLLTLNLKAMLPLFHKRRRRSLRFAQLEKSVWKDRYFYRTCRFTLVDQDIRVLNSAHNPQVILLDKWEASVYGLANGQVTVRQLVMSTARQYEKAQQEVPKQLDQFLLNILERFVKDYRIVEWSDQPQSLPYYLSLPIHLQDERRAQQQMWKDRFRD